jgi:hypothetical protein
MENPVEDLNVQKDITALRSEQSELANVLWLSLAGLLILTASIGVYLLRQDILLNKQSAAQKPVAEESMQRNEQLVAVAAEFQKFAASHPDYATNILARFGLKPISPAAAPASPAPAR